jgi:hypothetical protein
VANAGRRIACASVTARNGYYCVAAARYGPPGTLPSLACRRPWADARPSAVPGRGSGVELAQAGWRAPKLAIAEAPHRPREPDGDRAVVNLGDFGEFALELPRPDPIREHHPVADAPFGDRSGGTDLVKRLPARVDGVGDRDEMLITRSRRDRVEQLMLGILQSAILRL